MKHCVKFPDDKFLAVRPCLVSICFGNRPAAKLLGALLYRYNLRVENKEDAENQNAVKAANGGQADQDTSYRIFRRQAQLVEDMCGEMTEKTLHDVAVPMLQVLGFLDLEEYMQSNCYIVNIERVQQALNLYSPTTREQSRLEKFLIKGMQLEKFLITSDELEKFLIDKKNFQSGLEKVLIWNRNTSNCKRGRKSNGQTPSKGKNRTPKNIKEDSKKNKEEEGTYDSAVATSSPAPEIEEEYLPDFSLGKPTKEDHVLMEGQVVGAMVMVSSLTEEKHDSYSPVPPESGYTTEEDEQDGELLPIHLGVSHATNSGAGKRSASSAGVAPASAQSGPTRAAQQHSGSGSTKKAATPAEQPTLIVEKKPMTLEAQIDAAFRVLDHVRQIKENNPLASYVRYDKSKKALKALIEACRNTINEVNTSNITLAHTAMWDEPAWTSGKSWSDPGMLTVAKFCEHYEKYLEIGRAAAAPKPTGPAQNPERGVSGLKRWTPPSGAHASIGG